MLNPGVVNPKVGLLISQTCSCDCFEALRGPRHQVHTHLSVALFAAFFSCSTKFAYCKWWLDAVETWQQGYESVHFAARYSFLHCRPGLDEAQTKWQCPCGGYIVEPFKYLLHATANPQFLALELAQDNMVKDCMWLLRSSSKRQLHRLHKKTLHIYMYIFTCTVTVCMVCGKGKGQWWCINCLETVYAAAGGYIYSYQSCITLSVVQPSCIRTCSWPAI